MATEWARFERIVRSAYTFSDSSRTSIGTEHPFEARNIHPALPLEVRKLFDSGHCAQATFEALKFLDEDVQRISAETDFGKSLMLKVFSGSPPKLPLNRGLTPTDQSEQEGYRFIFAGAMAALRNPRGHKTGIFDDPDTCLDHLTLISMLLRKLEDAGLR